MKKVSHNSSLLYEYLSKLDKAQLKVFYCILVHYRVSQNAFISKQNVFDLWCELNKLCYEVDECFPDIYDHELVKSYCHEHPYYFIDILAPEQVVKLFCDYCDDKLDILANIAAKLHTGGLKAACESTNEALGLSEDIDELVRQAEEHLKAFS